MTNVIDQEIQEPQEVEEGLPKEPKEAYKPDLEAPILPEDIMLPWVNEKWLETNINIRGDFISNSLLLMWA